MQVDQFRCYSDNTVRDGPTSICFWTEIVYPAKVVSKVIAAKYIEFT